jgi:hypothetical protein
VRGTAGFVHHEVQTSIASFGSSFSERNSLAETRKVNINQLRQQLEACGNCSDRKRIEDDLNYWVLLNETIHTAEKIAVRAIGLEKYGDFDGIRKSLAEYFTNKDFRPSEAQKLQWAYNTATNAAENYCGTISQQAREPRNIRPLYDQCLVEHNSNFMVLQEAAAKAYCASLKVHERTHEGSQAHDNNADALSYSYTFECLEWNIPAQRLAVLTDRIRRPTKEPTDIVRAWCGSVGISAPTEGTTSERRSERYAQTKACIDRFNIAELIQQRDLAEASCPHFKPEQSSSPGFDSIACLYEKDPLRRMKLDNARLQAKTTNDVLSKFRTKP